MEKFFIKMLKLCYGLATLTHEDGIELGSMKRICLAFFLFLVSTLPALAETRAMWVTRWDYNTPDDVKIIIDNAVSAGINMIFFQVRGNGTVLYPSEREVWSEKFNFTDPGWDPLQLAVDYGHLNEIQIHAWVNVYPGWQGNALPDHGGQLYLLHPDWFMVDRYHQRQPLNSHYVWLSPTHPQVRDHLLGLCKEIYTQYDIDGLHLDYIRFPSNAYSYDEASLKSFVIKYGARPEEKPVLWDSWRRDAISLFAEQLYQEMKSHDPKQVLSASVIGDHMEARRVFLQDSHEWLARGAMDMLFPMIYTSDHRLFKRRLQDHLHNTHDRLIIPGIMVNSPAGLATQMRIASELGCEGTALFAYSTLFPNHRMSTGFRDILDAAWPERKPPTTLAWKDQINDNQGPLISQVKTIPVETKTEIKFKVAAQITDPSGVYDDATGSTGHGIYLVYDRVWPPEEPHQVKMSRLKKTQDWYVTDKPITWKQSGLDFRCRIFAWDDYHESGDNAKRNLGYSDVWSLSILTPDHTYINRGHIGPVLYHMPTCVSVDPNGMIWAASDSANQIFIFDAQGNEATFSPLVLGMDHDMQEIVFRGVADLSHDGKNIMYIVSADNPNVLFRFNLYTGEPLPGIELDFAAGAIDCDEQGNLFLLEKNQTRFHILDPQGKEYLGSPFGDFYTGTDIAVLDNAMMVLINDRTRDKVQCWHGAIEGRFSRYWQEQDIRTVDIGSGKVNTFLSSLIYIPHASRGIISILDRTGTPKAYLHSHNPPLRAPMDLAITASSDTLFVLERSGRGPTRLQFWERQNR
jgi:uncharacterized lipoprotein YddW (UPF0748 family)